MTKRKLVAWLLVLAVVGFSLWALYRRNDLMANGRTVYVKLGGDIPRSLLGFRISISPPAEGLTPPTPNFVLGYWTHDGFLVAQVDKYQVAHLVRESEQAVPVVQDEILLKYHQTLSAGTTIGAEYYYFWPWDADSYKFAYYAELRVAPSGDAMVVGLRGPNLNPLGPSGQE